MKVIRKTRIYLDTTIPNYLFADDRPDRMEFTWQLWERCETGEYEVFVSEVLFKELEPCPEPKLSLMLEKMASVKMKRLTETDEVKELAAEYIRNGALTINHFNDCLHIAYAVVYDCDIILSWNFDHTRDWTKGKVKEVNATNRYKGIWILSPDDFLKGNYE